MPRAKEGFNPLNSDFMSEFEPVVLSRRSLTGEKIVTKHGLNAVFKGTC